MVIIFRLLDLIFLSENITFIIDFSFHAIIDPGSFTSISGENMVGGLAPAISFGPIHDFDFIFAISVEWQIYFGYKYFL